MNSEDGKIWYGLGIDNAGLQADANKSISIFKGISNDAKYEFQSLTKYIKNVGAAIGIGFGIDQIRQFGMELINVRGQFQTFEAVLSNTLGDPTKAKASMQMIQDFAATTPFQVDALTGSFVKLANQGFIPTMQQMTLLGDLASSTGKGFDQLSEAIIDAQTGEFERLKEFGIRASKEGDKVTFTFKEQATQVDFTASSIRDYILSLGELEGVQGSNAAIAATLTGQVSNLQDAITQMYNKIGSESEGVLSGAVSGASYLVEHYEEVEKVLGVLIATYGSYKAALITIAAIEKSRMLADNIRLTMMFRKELGLLTAAQQAFNISAKANPYALLVTAVVAVGTAYWAFSEKADSASKAQKALNDNISDFNKNVLSEQSNLAKLKGELSALEKGTDAYNTVKDKIVSGYSKYYSGLEAEIEKVGLTEDAYNKLSVAIAKSFGARQYEAFSTQQQSELSETMSLYLGKIQDRLYKDLGDEKGLEVYTKIRNAILERKELDAETVSILDNVQDKGTIVADARLDGYIAKIRAAQNATDEFDEKARVKFGVDETGKKTEDGGEISSETIYGEEYRAAQKEWQDAKKAYEAIEKDRDSVTTKAFNDAKNRLDEAQKVFTSLGGETKQGRGGLNPVADEDKELIKGSIAWYEEQIQKLLTVRSSLTDADEIANIDGQIDSHRGSISSLNSVSEKRKQADEAIKAEQEQTQKLQEQYNERLNSFKTFKEQYAELEAEHKEKLGFISKKGGSQSDVDAENQDYESKLQSLNDEVLATIGDFEALGIETTDKVIDEMIAKLQKAKSGLLISSGGKENAQIQAVNKGIEKCIRLKEKNNNTSNGRTLKEWQDMESQLKDCVGSFSEIGEAIGGVVGETISAAGDITASTISMISGIVMLVENGVSGMTAAGKAGSAALKAVESASVILAVIGAVVSIVTKLYNLINGNKQAAIQEEIDAYNTLVETYDTLIDKQKDLLENSKQSSVFAEYNKALDLVSAKQKAAASSLKSWFSSGASMFKHSEGYKFNEEFGDYLSSDDLFSMVGSDWERFILDHSEVWGRLPQEVRDYAQEVIDASEETAELGDTMKESLTGISFDSLEDDFKDTLMDMNDDAEDFAENFANMMLDSLAQSLMDTKYNEMLTKWYDKYSDFMKDGDLDDTELANLKADWESISEKAEQDRESLKQIQSEVLGSASNSDRTSTSSSGITASQESVDVLDGRLTVMQAHTFGINENTAIIRADLSAIRSHLGLGSGEKSTVINIDGFATHMERMRDIASQQLSELKGINTNTARLEAIESHMYKMEQSIDTIRVKGIKIK
ncbi:MAG: hypothetical protein R3Y50_06045 [Rikenellaceae bacterium]